MVDHRTSDPSNICPHCCTPLRDGLCPDPNCAKHWPDAGTKRTETSKEWVKYERTGSIEVRPATEADRSGPGISISETDLRLPSLVGGMIARNPANHDDQWYIAAEYFAKHYRAAHETECTPNCELQAERDVYCFALSKLVRKLEAVHEDPRYKAVWESFMIHGGRYTEPTYTEEFESAQKLLRHFGAAQKAKVRRPCDWPDTHVQPCDCSVNEPPPSNGEDVLHP